LVACCERHYIGGSSGKERDDRRREARKLEHGIPHLGYLAGSSPEPSEKNEDRSRSLPAGETPENRPRGIAGRKKDRPRRSPLAARRPQPLAEAAVQPGLEEMVVKLS